MTRRQPGQVGLFSILAFVVALVAATDAQAICPFPICYTYKSSPTIPGSEVLGLTLYGDSFADIVNVQGSTFDTQARTPDQGGVPVQSFNCTYDGALALCSYSQPLVCSGFQAGTQCRDGERESLMQCTVAGAGCKGEVRVQFLDGITEDKLVPIFKDPAIGTDNKLCNTYFPTTSDLPRGVMGKVKQQCVKGVAWSPNDPVLSQVVRNDNDIQTPLTVFTEKSQWLNLQGATCNPADGLPGGACTNQGVINIAFQAPNQAACSAANLRCGQKASSQNFGPQPETPCSYDSVSGQCSCTCKRCDDEGITLVNVGFPQVGNTQGVGIYTIANESAGFIAACSVEITGTN